MTAMTLAPATLSVGDWGGEQVMLTVGADKAVLRLGCAEGEFAMPVALGRDGRFSQAGTYMAHGGGPSTASDRPARVRYEGTLSGSQLTLTVRNGKSVDSYQLAHGVQSKVIRCL
ncbi:hypothetical protein [Sphingomonas sp.]|uniref:hypothetical protein n=1 Tax=Sphingomonas sp. TaxID=28214 RepID=UPI002E105B06